MATLLAAAAVEDLTLETLALEELVEAVVVVQETGLQ
jgi:hypothetical protein